MGTRLIFATAGSAHVDTSYVFTAAHCAGGNVGSKWLVSALRRLHERATR